MEKSTTLSNGKGSNADKVEDSETTLLVSNKADKTDKENYLEDSETTPKSCLDVVFELLATTACTSSSNSLSHYWNQQICRLPWQTAKAPKADGKAICRQPQTANISGKESSGKELLYRLLSHSGRQRPLPLAFLGKLTAKKVDGKK